MSDYRKVCLATKGEECETCGSTENIVVHHIDGDRSNNHIENLVPLYRSCHEKIHGRMDERDSSAAFPFAEAKQSPLYPHRDRWEELEDAKFEMEMVLRQRGVRDVQGRELDDAILRYAIANSEEVAELVLEAREIDEAE